MARTKEEFDLSPETIAIALQNLIQNGGNFQRNTGMDNITRLLEEELTQRAATKTEEERILREAQLGGARAQALKRKQVEEFQNGCPHIKPNRQSAVAGQRDHSGNSHFICQYCAKEYTNGELPAYLAVDPNFIGGPTL